MRLFKKRYLFLVVISLFFTVDNSYSSFVSHWKFDEGTGQTYLDDRSSNNHLTRGSTINVDVNDPAYSSDTPHHKSSDYSIRLDGINDYAFRTNTSSLQPTGNFTLSTWVKIDSLDFGDPGNYDAQDIMISTIGAYGNSGGYQLNFANAVNPQVSFLYRNATSQDRYITYSLSSVGFEANTWYHITGTYAQSGSNSVLKLYIDGKLVEQDTLQGNISHHNTSNFYLGTNHDGLNGYERWLDGNLDETKIHNDTKSDSEVRSLAEIDIQWASAVSDVASNKSRWYIPKIPTYASNVILPDYGTPYTVTLDANWEINDLDIKENAKAYLGNHNLIVENGGWIRGTLELAGATYNANSNVNMSSSGLIVGYGLINRNISNNTGTIKAQGNGQQLQISLTGNDSEGQLIADQGATLYISNTSDITNRDSIILTGGTLKGHSNKYILENAGSSDTISGYGTIDNYYVNIGDGTLTANGNGKTLTLNEGFSGGSPSGTINVQSGAALNVLQPWTNYSAKINMYGGTITGSLMSQNNGISGSGLQVLSGVNSIKSVSFSSLSENVIANNATLQITDTATLNNATIKKSGGTGNFNIGTNATVQGYGTINPDIVNNGYLIANSGGNTLAINGNLSVASTRSAYATGGATLTMANTVNNQGNIYANTGSFVNINNTLTNTANVYSNGGTLNIGSNIYNRNNIYANTGNVNITGTIKAGTLETGGFSATNGNINISSGTIETGSRNIFTAYAGGTITLPSNFYTSTLYNDEALNLQGGTITLNSGQALTNSSGKIISGYGTLLGNNNNLNNLGTIKAQGGTLDVYGSTINDSVMSADGLGKLNLNDTLKISDTGAVSALNGGEVNIKETLINEGLISSSGNNSSIFINDTMPTGAGSFIAESGGTILFNDGFTNKDIKNNNAIQLTGGTIAVKNSTMTNEKDHTISGYGNLLDSADTLINHGGVFSSGGLLAISGLVENQGNIYSEGNSNSLTINNLNNNGTVSGLDSSIFINQSVNNGLIQAVNGAVNFGRSSGDGIYSLQNSKMTFRDLTLNQNAHIRDNNISSEIEIYGNLDGMSQAASDFDADNISMHLFSPSVGIIEPVVEQRVSWNAQDMGLSVDGLIENMAIGFLMFGDGAGDPESNLFWIHAETIIYCYGLNIQSDAELYLAEGTTIYYLKDGDEFNGIVGKGFVNNGSYSGPGNIYEISTEPIPEPSVILMFALGLGFFIKKKYRS